MGQEKNITTKVSSVKQISGLKTFEVDDDLKNYQRSIEMAADNHYQDMVISKGSNYAVSFMAKIIEKAEHHIRIFSLDKNFDYLTYEVIIKSIEEAQKRNVEVQILTNVENISEYIRQVYDGLLKDIPPKVFKKHLDSSPVFKSFITGDNCMYRIEYQVETLDGLGSFNDVRITENFNAIFDELYRQC